MDNKYLLSAVALAIAAVSFYSMFLSEVDRTGKLDVVFYNVENLFDIENDPDTFDDEFTPDSTKNWTQERYDKKLKDLAHVLSAVVGDGLPEAFGLCEIENRKVVEDLVKTDSLAVRKYVVVHEDSPDKRGIDVAFVYDSMVMEELYHEKLRYGFAFEPETTTRDILYVKTLSNKDTLHFFVNHWPSRRGGQEASEPKRLKAATVLRTKIDSILLKDKTAKVIAMGDFNDYPNNSSMTEVMNCEPGAGQFLTNLTYSFQENGLGTYNYKGEWGMLDQFIVSDGLLRSAEGFTTTDTSVHVFKEDWLLYFKEGKEPTPSRTYGGPNYYGGYSDHLPISLTLHLE